MDAEAGPLDPLLDKWRELSPGDRKGVSLQLDPGQRAALHRALAAKDRQEAQLAARAQRFSGCSPWLSELLDGCEKDLPNAQTLTPPVRAALLAGHAAVAENADVAGAPPSFVSLAWSLIKAVRERL